MGPQDICFPFLINAVQAVAIAITCDVTNQTCNKCNWYYHDNIFGLVNNFDLSMK